MYKRLSIVSYPSKRERRFFRRGGGSVVVKGDEEITHTQRIFRFGP